MDTGFGDDVGVQAVAEVDGVDVVTDGRQGSDLVSMGFGKSSKRRE